MICWYAVQPLNKKVDHVVNVINRDKFSLYFHYKHLDISYENVRGLLVLTDVWLSFICHSELFSSVSEGLVWYLLTVNLRLKSRLVQKAWLWKLLCEVCSCETSKFTSNNIFLPTRTVMSRIKTTLHNFIYKAFCVTVWFVSVECQD